MSGKSKIDPVLKVELVERYLRNEIGIKMTRMPYFPSKIALFLYAAAEYDRQRKGENKQQTHIRTEV